MALIDLNRGLVLQACSTVVQDVEYLHAAILLVLSTSFNRLLLTACTFAPSHQQHAFRSLGMYVTDTQP